MNITLLTLTFIAVNLDFFIMLLFLLKKYPLSQVLLGYLIGNLILMILSFMAGKLLENFLPEWLLGILGIIPIYLAFKDEDDESGTVTNKSPLLTVLITYLSVCAGCNLSIFLPVLLGETLITFLQTLIYISGLTVLIVFLLKLIERNHLIQSLINRFGEKLMKICYIMIGLYVLFDSGFLTHIYQLLFH